MQRWEYLTLKVDGCAWSDSLGRNGELHHDGDPAAILNDIGQHGWELTGVATYNVVRFRMFLKRPKP